MKMPSLSILMTCLAALIATTTATAQAPEDGEQLVVVYDVRDLTAVLPDERKEPAPHGYQMHGGYTMAGPGGQQVQRQPRVSIFEQESDAPDAGVELVRSLAEAMGMQAAALRQGLAVVRGSRSGHEQLEEQLRQVRALYEERYVLELRGYLVPAGSAPPAGAAASMDGPPHLAISRTVVRRQPTTVRSGSSRTYVADASPVVGDQTMAFDLQTETVEEGLSLTILVGAGEDIQGRIPLRADGELVSLALERQGIAVGTTASVAGEVRIDLPTITRSAIQSAASLAEDRPTVIAVTDAPRGDADEPRAFVLVARVKRAE